MITIYHNPRCSKSREGLSLLENSGKEFEIKKYMETPISEEKLKEIITLLGIKPIDLVRKNEAIWKSEFKSKTLTDTQVIKAMIKNPRLIERPIVINDKQAVIGRPPVKILDII